VTTAFGAGQEPSRQDKTKPKRLLSPRRSSSSPSGARQRTSWIHAGRQPSRKAERVPHFVSAVLPPPSQLPAGATVLVDREPVIVPALVVASSVAVWNVMEMQKMEGWKDDDLPHFLPLFSFS